MTALACSHVPAHGPAGKSTLIHVGSLSTKEGGAAIIQGCAGSPVEVGGCEGACLGIWAAGGRVSFHALRGAKRVRGAPRAALPWHQGRRAPAPLRCAARPSVGLVGYGRCLQAAVARQLPDAADQTLLIKRCTAWESCASCGARC